MKTTRSSGYALIVIVLMTVVVAVLSPQALVAQTQSDAYPTRPIRFVLTLSAGGTQDALMRILAPSLEQALGQPIIIDNRPGASGSIAADIVAKAAPDGYTVLIAATSLTVLPNIPGANAIDPRTALTPITKLILQPNIIVANPVLGVNTLPELIERARAAPGHIAYGTAGVGTSDHLTAVMLTTRAQVSMLHVPYNSIGAELKDLLAGEIPVAFMLLTAVDPYLHSGQLKAIGFTGRSRVPSYPDVPTVAESGYPGFEVNSWYGALAPVGTPPAIVDRLQRELARALQMPTVREKIVGLAMQPLANSPAEFADEIKRDIVRWNAVVKSAGILPQ